MPFKIFYSWQSDLPAETNESFIQQALEEAANHLSDGAQHALVIDRDTQGLNGSPDVANKILRKIDECDLFIADVSFINPSAKRRVDGLTPNPNVLLELGYAWKSKGEEKMLMVFNEPTGNVRALPFDLGLKRQILYAAHENSDNMPAQKKLVDDLINKISPIHAAFCLLHSGGISPGDLPEPHERYAPEHIKKYDNIPRSPLTNDQRLWLVEMYKAFTEGKKIKPHVLIKQLSNTLSEGFNPEKISEKLIDQRFNHSPKEPTLKLLGIYEANPDTDLLAKTDLVLGYIKQIIEFDPAIEELPVPYLATKLNLTPLDISLVMHLLPYNMRAFKNAGGNPSAAHYLDTFTTINIGDLATHQAYANYPGIENLLKEYFKSNRV